MGRSAREKRLRRLKEAGQAALLERVRQDGQLQQAEVRIDRQDQRKLSEVLLEFAGPFLPEPRRQKEYRTTIGAAILAWNLALLPAEEAVKSLRDEFAPRLGAEGSATIATLAVRKRELYPDDRRFVVDYELSMNDTGVVLNVVSMPTPLPDGSGPAAAFPA